MTDGQESEAGQPEGSHSEASWPAADAGSDGEPQEVELKYAVHDTAAVRALLDELVLEGVDIGPWRTRLMDDRYVDTADSTLAQAGFAARLRRVDGTVTLGIKGLGAIRAPSDGEDDAGSEALHRRSEHEAAATDELDPAQWPESDARTLIERLLGGHSLQTRFQLQQTRHERDIAGTDGDGGAALLSLDEVRVLADGDDLGTLNVLEIEARDDGEPLLSRIAWALEATGLVEPERRTKEEIARELMAARATPAAPRDISAAPAVEPARKGAKKPQKSSKDPGVLADDLLAEAGRKVLRLHLSRMLAREAGTRAGEDIEELHAMRVATRRMRATWRTFEGAYRPKRARRYVAELRDVAARLGAVRDLDVLLEGLDAYTASLDDGTAPGLEPLAAAWRARRDAARVDLVRMLDSQAYRQFVEDYLEFVDRPGAGAAPHDGPPLRVRDTAGSRVWQAYEQLRAHEQGLAWADIPTLHEMRIKGKRLRYALESFREVLGPEAAELIARVTQLQDHLGALNDADVASRLSREFLTASGSQLPLESQHAIGRYLGAREREIGRLRRSLVTPWRAIAGGQFRRSLGRAISVL